MIAKNFSIAILMCILLIAETVKAESFGSIILYHRFGDPQHPSTSVTVEQLDAHINSLESNGYRVVALREILKALETETPFHEPVVAITIDDAFRSLYTIAWPKFKAAGFPITVFVASDTLDKNLPDYMSWAELRELRDAGAEIGSQTVSHPHLPLLSASQIEQELQDSALRIASEIGIKPDLIAYPYGEASLEIFEAAKQAGYAYGFGQHSGASYPEINKYFIPRFALNEQYGNLDRFQQVTKVLPLRFTKIDPADPLVTAENKNLSLFRFDILKSDSANLNTLRCYHSQFGALNIQKAKEQSQNTFTNSFKIHFPSVLPKGRNRLNCTASGQDQRWHWFGIQYYITE